MLDSKRVTPPQSVRPSSQEGPSQPKTVYSEDIVSELENLKYMVQMGQSKKRPKQK